MTTIAPDVVEFLASRITIEGNGCWLWRGQIDRKGYGKYSRRDLIAHRYVYALVHGPIPQGMVLDHLCHNDDLACSGGPACLHRRCVNPSHLEPVTNALNLSRGRPSPMAAANAAKTHCKRGHEYSPENTYVWRGSRHCRACGAARTTRKKRRAS